MKRYIATILLLAVGAMVFPHTWGSVEKECTLCGHKFQADADFSGTQIGVRLDLRPLGPTPSPWRLAVCPKCHFVLSFDDLSAPEKKTIENYVQSDSYKSLVTEQNDSYCLLANLMIQLNYPHDTVAFAYLKASWQLEGEDAQRHRQYLGKSLSFFRSYLKQGEFEDESSYMTARFMEGEITRLLSRFDEAKNLFKKMSEEAAFSEQPYRSLVSYELELIEASDNSPKERPTIEYTKDDLMKLPEYKICYGLKGVEKVEKLFSIHKVSLGWINSAPHSLLVMLDPKEGNSNIVNSAWWFNPVDEDTQVAECDWDNFLHAYKQVNDIVSHHGWLWEWRNAGPDRAIQACILGTRCYTESSLENFVLPVWEHAVMKGSPYFEVNLRRAGRWCGTVFFSKEQSRALVVTMFPGNGSHFLDEQDFSFHPTQEIPEYIVVDRDGNWWKNENKMSHPHNKMVTQNDK